MDMKLSVPLLLGVSLLLGGCGKPASPDKVAVTVNGTPILEKQVILEIDGRINAEAAQDAGAGELHDQGPEGRGEGDGATAGGGITEAHLHHEGQQEGQGASGDAAERACRHGKAKGGDF